MASRVIVESLKYYADRVNAIPGLLQTNEPFLGLYKKSGLLVMDKYAQELRKASERALELATEIEALMASGRSQERLSLLFEKEKTGITSSLRLYRRFLESVQRISNEIGVTGFLRNSVIHVEIDALESAEKLLNIPLRDG